MKLLDRAGTAALSVILATLVASAAYGLVLFALNYAV